MKRPVHDERADRKLRELWCSEIDPQAKWGVKISGHWKYTIYAVHTTAAGALCLEFDHSTASGFGFQVLAELAPGGWQARVKL